MAKKLFLLVALACSIAACETGNITPISDNAIMERSALDTWNYYEKPFGQADRALQKKGWVLNFKEVNAKKDFVALYIFNRPGDDSWCAFDFNTYKYANQKQNREALDSLICAGKIYGELLLTWRCDEEGEWWEMAYSWLMAQNQWNFVDMYEVYSSSLYKMFRSKANSSYAWEGLMQNPEEKERAFTFADRQEFLDAARNNPTLWRNEDASFTSGRKEYNCSVWGTTEFDNFYYRIPDAIRINGVISSAEHTDIPLP